MKVPRLIAFTTLSTLCIAASAAVSANPVTFDGSAPAPIANGRLMNATQIAFPTPPQGPLDEVEALLNTIDALPSLVFPSSYGSPSRMVTAGGFHRSASGFGANPSSSGVQPSVFALDTPASEHEARAIDAKANVPIVAASLADVHYVSTTSEAPASTFVARSSGVQPNLQMSSVTQANLPDPFGFEHLYNEHRLFSDNPAVPFAEYDQSDHDVNDESADAFQNDLFVPGRPFPINQPLYGGGNAADYTTDLEVAAGLGLIAALIGTSGNHHKPIPENSSFVGLAALCAGGSLALMRGRRRTTSPPV